MIKYLYLDKNNNFIEKSKATKIIVQELDENGKLIKETFGSIKNENNIPKENPQEEITKEIYDYLDNYQDKNGKHIFKK